MRWNRALLLAAVLVLPAFAGCVSSVQEARDWWDGEGGLVVLLTTLPADAPGQRVGDFSTLKVAVNSVVASPVGEVAPHAGAVYSPPLGMDLRARFDEGEGRPVLQRSGIAAKAISRVEIHLILFEAKDNAGNTIPACPTDRPSEVKPCLATSKTGRFILDKQHNPPRMQRAKTMTMEFPIVVVYSPEANEYFLQSRSADEEAKVTFS